MEGTAWYEAAKVGNINLLKKLWGWSKERQTRGELKRTIWLAKNLKG
jgi:hypothetical protein